MCAIDAQTAPKGGLTHIIWKGAGLEGNAKGIKKDRRRKSGSWSEELSMPLRLYRSAQPLRGFPGGRVGKNPPATTGDVNLIPGSGRSPGIGNGNPFQYSCLKNSIDRGAWLATVHGVTKSWTD